MLGFDGFEGKAVLVTGASSGIGRETALAFGSARARVALLARRQAQLEEVADEIRARGGEAIVLAADITQRASVRHRMRMARKQLGRLDLVVNNAGVLIPAPVTAIKHGDLTAMFKVNVLGALTVMQQAVELMREQDDGCIVNVASLAGRRGVSPLGGYCATKFALVGLTEALRSELYDSNIHLGLVLPGVVDTPMAQGFSANEALANLWPTALNMPAAWVVWAIFAVARLRLNELAVPPGAAALEELAALVPGLSDSLLYWGTQVSESLAKLINR